MKQLLFLNLLCVPLFSMQYSNYRPEWCSKPLGVLQQEIDNPTSVPGDISILDCKKAYVIAYTQLCSRLLNELEKIKQETCSWIQTTSNPREAGESPWKALIFVKEKTAYTPNEIDELKRKIPAVWQHYITWSKMGPL